MCRNFFRLLTEKETAGHLISPSDRNLLRPPADHWTTITGGEQLEDTKPLDWSLLTFTAQRAVLLNSANSTQDIDDNSGYYKLHLSASKLEQMTVEMSNFIILSSTIFLWETLDHDSYVKAN